MKTTTGRRPASNMAIRRRRHGRGALLTGAAATAALLAGVFAAGPRTAASAAAQQAPAAPLFRFVSIPDFTNDDYGDTRSEPGWDSGDPVTINDSQTTALRTILDVVKAEHPSFVLDAGDLVNGRWNDDYEHTGIFGPSGTADERYRLAISAGDLYYGTLKALFASEGLRFYPTLGDHDVGDNPWPVGWVKTQQVPLQKAEFAKYFTLDFRQQPRFGMRPWAGPSQYTAYAIRWADTLIVSVDEFYYTGGSVQLTLDPVQLQWLAQRLKTARANGVAHIIVQGHLPVIGAPLPYRSSSRLMLNGGAGSAFWQLLKRYHVDLYLAGEMHAVSVRTDGTVQVVHGCAPYIGTETYLVGDVYADRIVVTVKQLTATFPDSTRMWQMPGLPPGGNIVNYYVHAQMNFDPEPTIITSFVVPNT